MLENSLDIGPLTLSPFGIAMASAFLLAYAILRWGFQWLDVGDTEDASAVVLGAGLGGIAGAKIYYAILYSDWRLLFIVARHRQRPARATNCWLWTVGGSNAAWSNKTTPRVTGRQNRKQLLP